MPTLYPTRLRFSHSFTHPWWNRFRPAYDSRVDPACARCLIWGLTDAALSWASTRYTAADEGK